MNNCNYRLLSTKEIIEILSSQKVCVVGTSALDNIKTTPMLYVFDYDNNNFTFYFISINNSIEIDNIKSTSLLSIFLENKISDFYINAYQYLSASGKAQIINSSNEKQQAIEKFKKKYCNELKQCIYTNSKLIKASFSNIEGREY